MNRERSFFGFIVAGAIALVLTGIIGFYWFFVKSPVSLVFPNTQPRAGIFVSKLAPVMVSLLVNPDKLESLDKKGEVSQLKASLFTKSTINYQEDIKPWLGNEITLAVTSPDLDHDPENGLQPGYLMAVATAKSAKSREFLELLFSQRALAGSTLAVERYKGVKLISDQPEAAKLTNIQTGLAGAVVDKFVLFANDVQVLRGAINNIQAPDLNLSSDPIYQKALEQIPKSSMSVAFLNLPRVAQWQGLDFAEATYNNEIIALILNSQGLLVESTFLTKLQVPPPFLPLSKPVEALKYIPESASLAIAGTNLKDIGKSDLGQLWKQGTGTIYGSGEDTLSRWFKPLVELQTAWGLNFAEDIFPWVNGEYALALLPSGEKTSLDWVFVVEKTPQILTGIADLNAIAIAQGINVTSVNLNQQQISTWTELTATTQDKAAVTVDTKILAAHTTKDNYEIFTSNLAILDQILTGQAKFLSNNPDFQDSIAPIPQPNQGYIYLDWNQSQQMLERQLPLLKFVEMLGKPLFNNLRSLTVSNYSTEPGTLKGGIFFKIDR
ncbi:DUF3352 domain-containing protein [Cronbergia sp. UHCC 0137]|uniref:DUF3352 domain-containing protein n=1 Tax=Cronbergia sp. UHCC 0137 TaxID=3110239 RepID=UPI002B2197AC|nr:DUF3352 domain-containing protein [Cronbergia sp. UHCC 0137]MEA5618673.1 DUF3352 domain-containing protein [Cronbergia sp. UHCC 0137]